MSQSQTINDSDTSAGVGPLSGEGETTRDASMDNFGQLVPVTEAIKYRKRAQAAEQTVEQLTRQLKEREAAEEALAGRLSEAQRDCELTGKLVRAGATDVEAALLLAKQQLQATEGAAQDVNSVIGSLRSERPYLFSRAAEGEAGAFSLPTAGAQSRMGQSARRLSRLAEQAAQSGKRKDMQEYLRLRRAMKR